MRILTDCKERLTEFVPAGTTWAKSESSRLGGAEQRLWRALAEGPVTWTAQPATGKPSAFWCRLIVIGEAARSQFDALHEALRGGLSLDGPTAVLALGGREFHGQRGRPWSTVAGNLFLTLGIPVGAPASDLLPGLIMLPAVAVVDAIGVCGKTDACPTIKWVNDILIKDRKVAGVLAASLCHNGLLEAVVLGLGVNVSYAPAVAPTPFVPAAGCLADAGVNVTLAQFLWNVLESVAGWCRTWTEEGPAALLRFYRDASCVLGRRVRVWDESAEYGGVRDAWPTPLATGVVRSIEADLSLKIDDREEPVARGRLALDEACVALGL